MKRISITRDQNVQKNIRFNEKVGIKHQLLREASVVDEFYCEKVQPCDSDEAVVYCDPIHILFNQERLNNMGAMAAKTFLDSLAPKSNSLSELRSKCSDEDLMSMMKSRHLQQPSEILAWCRYMNQNVETFNSEVAMIVAEREAQEQVKKAEQKVEVTETKTE